MSNNDWIERSLGIIQQTIQASLYANRKCNIMLTGGRSAAKLYSEWAKRPDYFRTNIGIHYYFGDERCVLPDHSESNYRLAMSTLFPNDDIDPVQVHRMKADSSDLDHAACNYDHQLPRSIDLLLLSIGEDGHIASLFPSSPALYEVNRQVVVAHGPFEPSKRLSVTPPVILQASNVLVLALGTHKRKAYDECLKNPKEVEVMPARLVLDRTWIFGEL